MKNTEIADIFYEMADLLEMQGVQWKPRAYRNAARAVDSAEDVEIILQKGGKKALLDIPGIGEALADKIIEYVQTGKIKEYERLTGKLPEGVHAMMHIMGVGPKKAWRLYKELGIKGVDQLEKACKKGKLRTHKGFGEKTEEDIIKGIATLRTGQERILLGKAWSISQEIIQRLNKIKGVRAIEPAGSLRRMQETIGDIDILVISTNPEKVMDAFTSMPDVVRILAKGRTKSSVQLKEGVSADVRVLEPKSFGAALQYFTGNKEHNIAVRQIAIRKGLKLSEYGVFKATGAANKKRKAGEAAKKEVRVAGKTEEEVYRALGLPYIPPEIREDSGEIEAAAAGTLPALVELEDIRGDLHCHSNYSDGASSLQEVAAAGKKKGYSYILVTDHSRSLHIANGLSPERLRKQLAEIDSINAKLRGFKLLKGSEVDILPDGSLDMDEALLARLDIVYVAIHSKFKMDRAAMTKRVIRAMENPYSSILAHPTGRLIGVRDAFEIDMQEVIRAAARTGTAIEINAHPARLDLDAANCRAAAAAGVMIGIGTDTHVLSELDYMIYGIGTARRGWLTKANILNARPARELLSLLRKKR